MSSHAAATTSGLTVRKLHPALGAEVRGVDMRQQLDAAAFAELHDIWMDHLVLIFLTSASRMANTSPLPAISGNRKSSTRRSSGRNG
jgi:alpha-ketoglutarate-dependent taurine dioxygenase